MDKDNQATAGAVNPTRHILEIPETLGNGLEYLTKSIHQLTKSVHRIALPHRPRILLIDDEKDILRSLNRPLSSHYRVTTAQSTEEALEALHLNHYAVVIADYHLGTSETGLDLLERIADDWPHTKRILHTGERASEFRPHLQTGLIEACIQKPSPASDIIEAIIELMDD